MARAKAKPFTKILILALIGAGAFFGFQHLKNNGMLDNIAPKKEGSKVVEKGPKLNKFEEQDVLDVCIVPWGGYAGALYFNNGFNASKNSRFWTEYGILVKFHVIEDYDVSRAAWVKGEVDIQWTTAESYPIEAISLRQYNPKAFFQSDWSRGGDVIVVRPGINNANDLRGKKIVAAFGTPSHSFLLWFLMANNMSESDIELIQVKSAVDAAAMAKSGNVDGALVWSPDDDDVINSMPGWKRFKTTKDATNIIAAIFYAKEDFIQANQEKLDKMTEGWLRGNAEINSSEDIKSKAAEILSIGLQLDVKYCLNAINNTRLCTLGDNKVLFKIDNCNSCVTGEQLYQSMVTPYTRAGLITETPPAWRTVSDSRILRSISLSGPEHEAEGTRVFSKATVQEEKAEAFASKSVSIVFPTGSSTLDANAQYIISSQVVPILKAFGSARVRVEGNTDNVGGRSMNVSLSEKRAQSAIDFIVQTYGFDPNRFIKVGNGPDKPVASNGSANGRAKNRRTEFQLLN